MVGLCGAHSPDTALSGCWLGSWGQVIGIRRAVGLTTAVRDVGVALVIATASFPDSAAVTASHRCRDVPDAATRADCPMGGPIFFSASTSLRAKETMPAVILPS
jgi:hypothetical protein